MKVSIGRRYATGTTSQLCTFPGPSHEQPSTNVVSLGSERSRCPSDGRVRRPGDQEKESLELTRGKR